MRSLRLDRFSNDSGHRLTIIDCSFDQQLNQREIKLSESFSDRHGYRAQETEITVREDAPPNLRYAIVAIAKDSGMKPSEIRKVVCDQLLAAPDLSNWSEYPNVWEEVQALIAECAWFKVYDIAEVLHSRIAYQNEEEAAAFSERLNQFFRESGIGWDMQEGRIVFRGSEVFAQATNEALQSLETANLRTTANEISEALHDISRRPDPDVTGAIQHAIAALESTAREVTGQANATLGQLIKPLGLPAPLDKAIEKLWGFSSDRARHVREGHSVHSSEAELIVSVACSICTFLLKRNQ